ncbi:MAG: hypothetical protein JWR37_1229 [Mycobacterium sp.]|nr:hypothetical protein [Mycobacterium sp.]
MKIRDAIDQFQADNTAAWVYSEPYQTPDGSMVIAATRIRGRSFGNKHGADDVGSSVEFRATPVGVFVIRDGNAKWRPATDGTWTALMGEFIGLASAVLALLAVVRRPPWPDVSSGH